MSTSAASAYLRHLGLARSPFPPTPDADSYFHTGALELDLAEATHCLLARKGFVLLTGEVGMGKSTFLRRLLDRVVREGAIASLVFNTFLQGQDLLAAICRDFGLEPGADAAANLDAFNRFLLRRWNEGTTCVLVIDDAQNLGIESLELLRLLSNLESGQEKLLQIVLAGQSELDETLATSAIRQLTSRIVKHIRMQPLGAEECVRYVEFRLATAGAAEQLQIEPGAHAMLHRRSAGNPRRIHLIMDRCLYGVIARGQPRIDAGMVRAAASEAGFLPTRRRWRYWPLAAAALLATGLASAGVVLWPTARPAAPPPPASPAPPSASGWDACLQRLSPPAGDARAVQVFDLPARFQPALAHRDDTCLTRSGTRWLAAWRPSLPLAQLQAGLRSNAVQALQQRLLEQQAFDSASGEPADGLFGPQTRQALARFQQRHQLPANGNADPLSLLLLELPASIAPSSSPEPAHVRR